MSSAKGATPDAASVVLFGGLLVLAASVATGANPDIVAPAFALGALVIATSRQLLQWKTLVAILIAVILFVPIGRYKLHVQLPFELELYRLTVMVLLGAWAASLLVDDRVRLRRSPLDRAIVIILLATVGSVAVNVGRVTPLQSVVLKSLTFFASYLLLYYFIVSVVRKPSTVEWIVKIIVVGASAVAVLAVVEQRVGYNIFDHVSTVLPILSFQGAIDESRFGLVRAVASAQHPIALGVLLAIVFPLALAIAFHAKSRRWWIPPSVLIVAALATVSRTPVVVLLAGALVLLWFRPREISALLPLIVPLVILVKLAVPGSLGTLKSAFFPAEGIVAEQATLVEGADPLLAGGRVRLLGPSLHEAARRPILGQGFSTRQTGFDNPLRNAPILDNQWLGLLLEIGIVGIIGWAWLIFGSVRRLRSLARNRAGPSGWIASGLAASIVGFAVGMFTYDSLAFVQVALLFWVFLALSACLVLAEHENNPGLSAQPILRRVFTNP